MPDGNFPKKQPAPRSENEAKSEEVKHFSSKEASPLPLEQRTHPTVITNKKDETGETQSQPPVSPSAPPQEPNTYEKTASSEEKVPPPGTNGSRKPPFMLVTIFLMVIVSGFTASFLFFRYTSPEKKIQPAAQPAVTPPVEERSEEKQTAESEATYQNPFISPTSALENPFSPGLAEYENPFGNDENPFSFATESGESQNQSYQNPFEQ